MKFYLVGGAVRDELLGMPIKERDWVVVGSSPQEMKRLGFQQVGKEFPVFLHPKTREEYALARIENKTNPCYKGFSVEASPDVTLNDDLLRRDLTINAMARDEDGNLLDPYGGKADLAKKNLRHVSPAFKEDPVRILRIARFLARYQSIGFVIDPATMQLMQEMVASGEVDALVAERVFKELERALAEPHPEAFFNTLAACGALAILFPGIDPRGESLKTLIAAAKITGKPVIRFAALMHTYPERPITHLASIKEICKRYRTPVYYQELAMLVHQHYRTGARATSLNAEALLDFFYALDIFRRHERFSDFLIAMKAIDGNTASQWLESIANQLRTLDIKPLIAKGLDGKTLGDEIREYRLKELKRVL